MTAVWTMRAHCLVDGCGWQWRIRLPHAPKEAAAYEKAAKRQGEAHLRTAGHSVTYGMYDEAKLPGLEPA